MDNHISDLVDRLTNPEFSNSNIISWGSPVPSFGDLLSAKIATLGINPSNREFVDENGNELKGSERRFHTLNSLGINKWSETNRDHLNSILETCINYFQRNPYDRWFKKLDFIISGSQMSYYFPSSHACHLDLIPYATAEKWGNLTTKQKKKLLKLTGDSLGRLLKDSQIQMLVLNGTAVIENFSEVSNVKFKKVHMQNWTLPRKSNDGVPGYAYTASVNKIGGINLDKEIVVIGYNHNIQSSFGVTKEVQTAIRNWVSNTANEIFE